jgi:hypothetical protein
MGYSTDFTGQWELSRPLTDEEANYLIKFADTRRMMRDVKKLMERHKGEHGLIGVPKTATAEEIYGIDGAYFVGGGGFSGQDDEDTVIDFNTPPGVRPYNDKHRKGYSINEDHKYVKESYQPGLWCQWVVIDNKYIEWDGGEKFYNYIEWIEYIIKNFLTKWDVKLNGVVEWEGEDKEDIGKIVIQDNEIKVFEYEMTYTFKEVKKID